MTTLYIVLLILALVCFVLAAVSRRDPLAAYRLQLLGAGLALWVLVPLIQQIKVA